jgi:nucleotidyltransferase substrate binding protein (TIGR01987 family)
LTADVRWIQRFNHFKKALGQLKEAVELSHARPLSSIETQGLIKAFEFTHELAWNVMKDFFVYQGNTSIMGSRDATREAFQNNLIDDGDNWMEMIKSRNQTSHTYNEDTAAEISKNIVAVYFELFQTFRCKLDELAHDG